MMSNKKMVLCFSSRIMHEHFFYRLRFQWFLLAPIMQSKSGFNLNAAVIRLNCDFCWCGTKKHAPNLSRAKKNVRTDYCKSLNELTASAIQWDFHRTHEMHLFAFSFFMQPFNIFRMNAKCWKVNGEPKQDREQREKKIISSKTYVLLSAFNFHFFFFFSDCWRVCVYVRTMSLDFMAFGNFFSACVKRGYSSGFWGFHLTQ